MENGYRFRWKCVCVLLICLLFLTEVSFPVGADTSTVVQISPATSIVSPGDTFLVNVSCIPCQPIKGFEFQVSFNPTLLQANAVTEGTIFEGYSTFFNDGIINNVAGTIVDIYDLIVGIGMVSGAGTFVGISFTALSSVGVSSIGLSDVGVTNETTYVPVTASNGSASIVVYTLSVSTSGQGSVVKNPNQPTYGVGDVVTLTATPDIGWSFDHWSGDLSGSVNPTTITMTGNKSVTATFTQNQYTLTVSVSGNGSVVKNPSKPTYVYGEVVTLTATANAGWVFDHWSGNLSGSANPTTITMNGNRAVTATFAQNQYTLTITVNGSGSVIKNPNQPTYTYGQIVTLTAVANTGWTFNSWGGNLSGNQNPKTITMNGNKVVTASFVDTMTPQISGVNRSTSNPLDTDPSYGWINVSATVTDNVGVSQVVLKIHSPGGSWNNVTMTSKTSGTYYYRSTTAFSTAGNYSYFIWAKDTSNNGNSSSTVLFSMPANWDVNIDGYCSILDLVFVSNHYGQSGSNGWIREDADNNGFIQVLDIVTLSNHYGETWF